MTTEQLTHQSNGQLADPRATRPLPGAGTVRPAEPGAAAASARRVQIVLDDAVVGSVDPATLTAGAQLDLEDCQRTRELIGWLVRYAGADAVQVEQLLRPMPLQAIVELASDISAALGQAITVPKRNARR